MRKATQGDVCDSGPPIRVRLGKGDARIDGVVGDVAIEIEARVSKQVRGAIVDLLLHPAPKKLLVLLPVHRNMHNPELCATQCRFVLDRFATPDQTCRVVVLSGHGDAPHYLEADVALIRRTLEELA